jgi:3-hydroxybutyryl-CoA dehydratase
MIEEAKKLTINNIKIGLTKEFKIIITKSMVDEFAKISGDFNPLHMDDKYAMSTKFGKRICHGMLLASFFSRIIGMYIPGKMALYLTQSLKFSSPCYIGDTVLVIGKVIDKSLSTKMITLKTKILRNNTTIMDGEAKVLVRD